MAISAGAFGLPFACFQRRMSSLFCCWGWALLLLVRSCASLQAYRPVWQAMQEFTKARHEQTVDELWLLQHQPVYTQGLAGKDCHVLDTATDIPVIRTDRGGQVTYHGPGQLMVYTLFDIDRMQMDTRAFVCRLEAWLIATLAEIGIKAQGNREAPGVYVGEQKMASIGLRVKKGRAYHGAALNVSMSLCPFARINPCGYAGLQMTDCQRQAGVCDILMLQKLLLQTLPEYWPFESWQNFPAILNEIT